MIILIKTQTYLSNYQIYKSSWSLTKCLYLACRFSLLLGWPFAMYAFLVDHDMESCKPILVIITALFMLFVCSATLSFFRVLTLLNSLTRPYYQLALLSSMHICPPRICNHGCKALVIARLSTQPLCLLLRRLPVFPGSNDPLGRRLSEIRQNRLFQVFPS